MRATGWLVVFSAMLVGSGWLIVSGWRQPRPALRVILGRLQAPAGTPSSVDGHTGWTRWTDWVGGSERARRAGERWAPSLRLIGRTPETQLGLLAAAALVGFVTPSMLAIVLRSVGVVSLTAAVPAAVSLAAAVLAPAIVHADAMSRADDVRIDVRYQLSAYLDMVVMLLAGNMGHEGALQQAARAGDGLLFQQLRRRMREVGATGQSLVEALSLVAADYDLVELEQVAATTSLSAAQGAPVSRTLAAKCTTLRGTIAAEQEAAARVRTDKVTPPLVGMALLFMALIIYPALNIN